MLKKEIVIISHWFGHTFHFMECVLPYFLERGYKIYHVTDKPEEAERFLRERLDFGDGEIENMGIEPPEVQSPSWRKDAQLCCVEAHWKGVQMALEKLYSGLGRKVGIFHTWVDLYSHEYLDRRVIAEAMPAPWCGLYLHPAELRIFKTWKRRLYENVMDLLKKGRAFPCRLKAFDVTNAKRIYFLDELVLEKARRCFRKGISLSAFPEWIDSYVEPNSPGLDRISQKAGGRKIICLCGFLSKRKGLFTLLEAAQNSLKDWFFVFAGPIEWESFNEKEKEIIRRAQTDFTTCTAFIDRQLKDGEINAVIRSSDLVYIAYENFFHSSNVQVKAASFQKPIIAGPQHLIAERTRKYQMGWCLPQISSGSVVDLLNNITVDELIKVKSQSRYTDFCAQHSPEKLDAALDEILLILSAGV